MSAIRILVVDDHEVVRAGLQTVLQDADDLDVVGEAATADEAVARARALRPGLVLMDVRLGEGGNAGGIEACRAIRSELPETKVLMFSSYGEREAVVASILAGAAGYVTKNVARAQLLEALRAVARGDSLLDPKVTGLLLDKLKELSAREPPPDDPLSPREREVLARIARGLTNREIAEELVISEHTARNHVTSILDKLGFSRRAEAAAYAARLGLTPERLEPPG
jgi:DNA-binding NarL/FixJ family response regulator